ncbi:hypothetical protein [uncultured Kordia sp.]|uniref:hypothetical protein n=1 Tax=uncultured Kordia sp. TaxID=507699 RepID=UPI00260E7537|nr:hypothetical protein [uncultured Kordia sp.]
MNDNEIIDELKNQMQETPELFEAVFFLSDLKSQSKIIDNAGHLKIIPLPKYQTDYHTIDSKYHKPISRCFQ